MSNYQHGYGGGYSQDNHQGGGGYGGEYPPANNNGYGGHQQQYPPQSYPDQNQQHGYPQDQQYQQHGYPQDQHYQQQDNGYPQDQHYQHQDNGYPQDKPQHQNHPSGPYPNDGYNNQGEFNAGEEDGERGLKEAFYKQSVDQYGMEHSEFRTGRALLATAVIGAAAFGIKKALDNKKKKQLEQQQGEIGGAYDTEMYNQPPPPLDNKSHYSGYGGPGNPGPYGH
ncbi:hypothetical protein EV175_001795 [Coemansia sp. RSA 1933]|nr:hypothetical protein EV175_001795 [Coemansia sp. RSA 1933]